MAQRGHPTAQGGQQSRAGLVVAARTQCLREHALGHWAERAVLGAQATYGVSRGIHGQKSGVTVHP